MNERVNEAFSLTAARLLHGALFPELATLGSLLHGALWAADRDATRAAGFTAGSARLMNRPPHTFCSACFERFTKSEELHPVVFPGAGAVSARCAFWFHPLTSPRIACTSFLSCSRLQPGRNGVSKEHDGSELL